MTEQKPYFKTKRHTCKMCNKPMITLGYKLYCGECTHQRLVKRIRERNKKIREEKKE